MEYTGQRSLPTVQLKVFPERMINPTGAIASGRETDWGHAFKQWFSLDRAQSLWAKHWSELSLKPC